MTQFWKRRSRSRGRSEARRAAAASWSRGPLLALDWGETEVTALHIRSTSGAIVVERQMTAAWPSELASLATGEAGEWLRTELRRAGLPLMPAVVCAPRRRGFLKLLEIPPVSGDLLADIVRSQAEHRMGTEAHGAAIDFLPLPTGGIGSAMQTVLAAALAGETLRQIQGVLASAAIPVLAIGFGELGLPALAAEEGDGFAEDRLRLHLVCEQERVELVLSQGGLPLASQSLPGTERNEEEVQRWLATAERLRLSLPEAMRPAGLSEIVLGGPAATKALPILQKVSPVPIRSEPFTTGAEWRALAYVASLRSAATAIDFANPRRAADPRIARRRRLCRAALWAAVLAAPLAVWWQREHRALDRELERLKAEARDQTAWIERGRPLVAASKFLDEWQLARTDWGAELTELLPLLPSDERGYLERLQLDHREGDAGSIQVTGLAQSADEIAKLNTTLVRQNARYELQPRAIEPNSLDTDFRVRFHTDLVLRPPADDSGETDGGDRDTGATP